MRLSSKFLATLMLSVAIISGCSEVSTKDMTTRLNDNLLSMYNLLRWNNFQQISLMQTDKYKNIRLDYSFLKTIKVNQVHKTAMQLSEDNTHADVFYDLEFYVTDTNTTHAIVYHQEWITEEENKRTWKLNSPLPDFKKIIKTKREPKIKVIEY